MHVFETLHAPHSKNDKTINIENTVRIRIHTVVELSQYKASCYYAADGHCHCRITTQNPDHKGAQRSKAGGDSK
jgi:hypothetical protein